VPVALAVVDATIYWMSAKIPTDQFLLYAFDGEVSDLEDAVAQVLRRATGCPDLTLRIDDRGVLRYPAWVRRDVTPDQVVVHGPATGWRQCLDAVAVLAENQLDLRDAAWRLHVFSPVPGVPGAEGPSTVTVVQMGHALGDGVRSSALAAVLFGRTADVPGIQRRRRGSLVTRGLAAARAHHRLGRDTAAGLVPPPAPTRPALSINGLPGRARTVRTFTRRRSELGKHTVTVTVLAITTSGTRASGCTRSCRSSTGPTGSPPNCGSVGAGPLTRRSRRATGRWPRCRLRCCVGASGNSTPTPARPSSPETPWCPASTADPLT